MHLNAVVKQQSTFYGNQLTKHLSAFFKIRIIHVEIVFSGHSDVSQAVLLREILYAFQGIQGQVFYWDATNENLLLKPTVRKQLINRYSCSVLFIYFLFQIKLPKAVKQMVQSLVELGWLFRKVQRYCESPKNESNCGLAARAFAAALQEELSLDNYPFQV